MQAEVSSNSITSGNRGIMPWLVVFSAALYFFFEFIQMNSFNALDPYLMQAFHIGSKKLGELSAYYFYGDVLFLFIAGMVLDRFSTKKLIMSAMIVSVVCTFLFASSSEFWQAGLCRFVTGLAAAFCFLSSVRLASRWFPPRRMALVVGCIVTFAMLGGLVAQTPFTLLADHLGWRHALMLDSVLGLLLLVIILIFVKDFPPNHAKEFAHQVDDTHKEGVWHTVKRLISNKQNWLGGFYTSLLNLPVMLLGVIWGVMYLVHVRDLSRTDASLVTSMIFIGTIIGSPVLGWLSDKLKRRKAPMLWGSIVSIVIAVYLIVAPHLSFSELLVMFFLLGFVTSAQVISYPMIAESNPLNLTGGAEGLAATIIMAGGLLEPVFGWVLQMNWNHVYHNHLPVYSLHAYNVAMWIMPVAFVVSFILALFVKETRCISYEEVHQQ